MPLDHIIRLSHISLIRDNKIILYDVTFSIDPGQHWAIVGPNGSGKTSLISIISGYHWPSEGEVEVLGERFGSTDLRELRRSIGECSSEIRNMIHNYESVRDIVLSGRFASIGLYESPSEEDHERADELLEFFGLAEIQDRPFEILSDGEKQKTILARALMPEPGLLVLDEPCAGLDIRAREELLDSIQRMCSISSGPALIYVTHHIEEIVPAVTHALVLKQGRVVSQGPRNDVLTGEVLGRTFDIHIDVHERGGRLWPVVLKSNKI